MKVMMTIIGSVCVGALAGDIGFIFDYATDFSVQRYNSVSGVNDSRGKSAQSLFFGSVVGKYTVGVDGVTVDFDEA